MIILVSFISSSKLFLLLNEYFKLSFFKIAVSNGMKVKVHEDLVFIILFHFSLTNMGCFLVYARPLTSVDKRDNASFHVVFLCVCGSPLFLLCFSVYWKVESMLHFSDLQCAFKFHQQYKVQLSFRQLCNQRWILDLHIWVHEQNCYSVWVNGCAALLKLCRFLAWWQTLLEGFCVLNFLVWIKIITKD